MLTLTQSKIKNPKSKISSSADMALLRKIAKSHNLTDEAYARIDRKSTRLNSSH